MSPARSRLATDLLVDLATFFHPPTLYQPLRVLTPPDAASAMMACGEQVQRKEISMQEAYLRQMKTAIRDQAFDFASERVLRHRGRRRGQA